MKQLRTIISFLSFLTVGVFTCHANDVALRTGDQLIIRLGGVPSEDIGQISGSYTVDGGGNINLPYLGKVHAAGLKQADVQSSIEAGYKNGGIYTSPIITISVQFDRLVDVEGDVRAPQRVHYTPDLTLLGAIAATGGFTDYADQSKVTIMRNGQMIIVNVKKVRDGQASDPGLEPGDKVIAKRSFW